MYDQHYGLSGRPFQLTPDPRFWFDTATHKKAMAYLGYGLSQGEGFIVITGDVGAGKTTLVGHLVDTVDADRLNIVRIVSTQIAADDLLRTVCAGLDVDANGFSKAQMLAAIERGLHAVARQGRRTLLVVDEAQALPVDSLEELRMLSNFQAGGHALLQIFLLGQPEFRDNLADAALEQLRQRVIAMHHLGPMDADELEPYLVHRLTVVGWDGRPRFEADALAVVYAWSGGIPRRINQLVSRVLLHGAIDGIDSFAAADVHSVIGDMAADGMTGGDTRGLESEPDIEPELELETPQSPAIEIATVEDPETFAPTLADEPVAESSPMEWPFMKEESQPAVVVPIAEWRPIVDDGQNDGPAEDAAPTELAPPVADATPEADPAWEETRPASITAPVSLFDRISLRGRTPMLAPVDPAPEPPVADESEPVPVADLDVARRLAEIDRRLEDQDAALRRVLTLLVDWVEGGRPDAADGDFAGLRDKVG